MSEVWWRTVDAGVHALAHPVVEAAWNPGGTLLAVRRAPRDASDSSVRQCVWCIDDASGEVLARLGGEATVRALGWLDAERLAVLRDDPAGMQLRVHALPDGGTLATRVLRGPSGWSATLSRSVDGRALVVAPAWNRTAREAPPALILDAESLEPGAVIAPGPSPFEASLGVDDEGRRWALLAETDQLLLGRCGEGTAQRRSLAVGAALRPSRVRWVDRDTLMVLSTSYGRGAQVAVTDDGATSFRETFRYLRPEAPIDWEADGPDDFFPVPLSGEAGLAPAVAFIRVVRDEGPRAELLLVDPRDGQTRTHPLPHTTTGYGLLGVHDRGDHAIVLLNLQPEGAPTPNGVYRTVPGGLLALDTDPAFGLASRLLPVNAPRIAALLDRGDAFELRRIHPPR